MTEQPSGQQEMQSEGPHQNAGSNTAADAGPNTPSPGGEFTYPADVKLKRDQEGDERAEPTEPELHTGRDMITRAELHEILEEREALHREQLQAARAGFPSAQVPAHSGGPGADNHQRSWNLAEQEASLRGETLEHWQNV